MKRFLALSLLLGACSTFGLLGCAEEAKVTDTREITSPEGTTTITEEKKVETTGDAPPPSTPIEPTTPK